MPKTSRNCAGSLLFGCLLLPGMAFAHPEQQGAADAWAGFLHPLTGIDHVLAMVAVGVWAVQLGRSAIWILPATFPAAMIVGVLLAQLGIPLPGIEPMIALSVMLIGAAVAVGWRMPVTVSALLIGFFAIFHGYAHSIEAPGDSAAQYAGGFISATVLLHLSGLMGGAMLVRNRHMLALRIGGSAIVATGAALLMT